MKLNVSLAVMELCDVKSLTYLQIEVSLFSLFLAKHSSEIFSFLGRL